LFWLGGGGWGVWGLGLENKWGGWVSRRGRGGGVAIATDVRDLRWSAVHYYYTTTTAATTTTATFTATTTTTTATNCN